MNGTARRYYDQNWLRVLCFHKSNAGMNAADQVTTESLEYFGNHTFLELLGFGFCISLQSVLSAFQWQLIL